MDSQAKIDALITSWQKTNNLLNGKEALVIFEPLTSGSESWASISEEFSDVWSPESAYEIEDSLDEERVEELAEGEEPNEEELDLWNDFCFSRMVYAELIHLHRLQSSTDSLAWFALTTDGQHQGSVFTDAAGPFLEPAALAAYLAEKVKTWSGWQSPIPGGEEGRALFAEVQRLSGIAPNP